MAEASGTAPIADPHIIINLPSPNPERSERRRCIKSGVVEQLFTGPELAKLLLTLDFGGLFATPVIYYNQYLPEYYLLSIAVFLFIGLFSLLPAIVLRKTFPNPAAALGLIGTASVVAVIPTITAGVLPKLRVLVWLVFSLLLLIPVLLVLLAHFAGRRVHAIDRIPDAASEIGVGKGRIEPSIASIEMKSEMPEVKLGTEDDAQKVGFWDSGVVCYVPNLNPPLKVMKGFFTRVWGGNGIDKILKLKGGVFVVRFRAYSRALKVVEGRQVVFDGKPVITKLYDPNLVSFKKDQICVTPLICEACKSCGDQCRNRSQVGKKMWVPKTSGKVVAALNTNQGN